MLSPDQGLTKKKSITVEIARFQLHNRMLKRLSPKNVVQRFKLRPQPAGHVVGDVNEAYKHPLVSPYEGGFHWTYERIGAALLIPLVASPFILGADVLPIVDTAFCVVLLQHCTAGFRLCITDYIPERVYGIWSKIANKTLTLGSVISLYGIYVLETAGNGIFELMSQIWSL